MPLQESCRAAGIDRVETHILAVVMAKCQLWLLTSARPVRRWSKTFPETQRCRDTGPRYRNIALTCNIRSRQVNLTAVALLASDFRLAPDSSERIIGSYLLVLGQVFTSSRVSSSPPPPDLILIDSRCAVGLLGILPRLAAISFMLAIFSFSFWREQSDRVKRYFS